MSEHPHDPYARRFAYYLPSGAQLCAADTDAPRCHFRLWAPEQATVQLEYLIPGEAEWRTLEMTRVGREWFEGYALCGAGTRYRFRLDGGLAIPDPASRAQPSGPRGPSEVVDPRAYAWRHTFWNGRPWEEMVLYAIDPGAAGGFEALRQRLPQLAKLGVTALELLEPPTLQSGGLPFAPSVACGGPTGLKQLIDTAHGMGLAVLLDCDYERFGQGSAALRRYAEPFFAPRDAAQDAPLSFERAEVRDFFCDNARYWLEEYRFDGLHLREADRIGGDWLREIADRVHATVAADRLVHLVLGSTRHPVYLAETHFDAQLNDSGERALYRLTGRADRAGETEVSAHQSIHALARALSADGVAYRGEEGDAGAPVPLSALVLSDGATRDTRGTLEAGRAALALSLLTPQIPLLFAEAVREPARRRCAQAALAVRAKMIAPSVADARADGVVMLSAAGGTQAEALLASWRLGDGEMLSIALNLSDQPVPLEPLPPGRIVFETTARARDRLAADGTLEPHTLVAWLTGDINHYASTHGVRRMDEPAMPEAGELESVWNAHPAHANAGGEAAAHT